MLLSGQLIRDQHCKFINEDGVVSLLPEPMALCYVNGKETTSTVVLHTGNRVILGKYHVFRYNDPQEARQSRHNLASAAQSMFCWINIYLTKYCINFF